MNSEDMSPAYQPPPDLMKCAYEGGMHMRTRDDVPRHGKAPPRDSLIGQVGIRGRAWGRRGAGVPCGVPAGGSTQRAERASTSMPT
jgi:hypothetical protein